MSCGWKQGLGWGEDWNLVKGVCEADYSLHEKTKSETYQNAIFFASVLRLNLRYQNIMSKRETEKKATYSRKPYI